LTIRDRVCTDFECLKHAPKSFLTPQALQREADAISMKEPRLLSRRAGDG
jgi:hypothetical protein